MITATRFPELRTELPIGVTVISADDLKRSASSNLADILAQFGLVHVRDNAGTPNAQLDLRGFGATGDQNTLVLLDGVRISENELQPAQLSGIPLDSIERIEIVRGGGAVLYGGGASGGTINIITKGARPGAGAGRVLARAGGYGTRELRADYGRPGETLGFSVALADENTSGYRRNNRFRQTGLSATLDARRGGASAYLKLGVDEQSLRLPGSLTEAQIAADPRQTLTPDDYSRRHGGRAVLGGAWRSGNTEWSADLAWRDRSAQAFFALFGGFYIDTQAEVWSFLPRLKWRSGQTGRDREVVIGADFDRWDYRTRSAAGPATIGTPFSQRSGEQSNAALYAQGSFPLGEATRLTAGARVQRHRDRLTEQVFPPDDRSVRRSLRAYELAARHTLRTGWSAYARAGRSFRTGNFDDNACFFPPCASRLLEPQVADTGELGTEFERGGLRLRASVHETRLRDEIYFSPLVFANINLSPTRRRGFEFQADWRVARQLLLNASFARLEARFRSGTYGGIDVTGKTVPLVPRSLVTVAATWSFAPATRLNGNLRWVGRQHYDNDQANSFGRLQPGYAVAGLKLEHRIGRAEFALEASNLFDRRHYSYGVWDFGSSFSAFPAPGRAVFATLAWRVD